MSRVIKQSVRTWASPLASTLAALGIRANTLTVLGLLLNILAAMMLAAGHFTTGGLVFLLFNALGGLVWGIGYSLLGYLAGNAWAAVAHRVGTYAGLAIGGLAVIALAVWAWRRHRRGPRAS